MATASENIIKPYTTKELTVLYGVSNKTLRTWLTPHQQKVGKKISRYYTALQVKVIFEVLGIPGE